MGLILQRQRRAIESLAKYATKKFSITSLSRMLLKGEGEIFPWGVSEGFGTCSDIENMNVLVLGKEKPKISIFGDKLRGQMKFAFAILFDKPTDFELTDCHELSAGTERECVELLNFIDQGLRMLFFERTGHRAIYVPL